MQPTGSVASDPFHDFLHWVFHDLRVYSMLGRAFQGIYFPASTFKLVTALAALKSGAIDENTMFEGTSAFQIGDRVFHNWNRESEGMLNVEGAIKRSCNTWFYQAALKTGTGPILDVAAQLGFGQPTGLPIPETAKHGGEHEGANGR